MQATDVKWIQIENTSRCNAWCSSCSRNNGGFGLSEGQVDMDLSVNRLEEVLSWFPNLDTIQFCGTYGDAAASPLSYEHFEVAASKARAVNIHTNGSLRTPDWWASVAKLLPQDHEVWFTLDGLAGTHEYYRQGTSWQKTIDNATAFIAAGGHAVWQFIPFKHNEHEIKDCIRLSQQLGFKRFKFVKDVRYPTESRHYRTGDVIEILPWSRDQQMSRYKQPDRQVSTKDCRHLQDPSVYLNADGKVSTCCFFNKHLSFNTFDQLPDIEKQLTTSVNQRCLHSCGTCATIDTYDDN